jgi:hypothetical protein
VIGVAALVTLVQFLINVVAQLWDGLLPLRPFTLFFYYQPQQIILSNRWTVELGQAWTAGRPLAAVPAAAVLACVGAAGYAVALWVSRISGCASRSRSSRPTTAG